MLEQVIRILANFFVSIALVRYLGKDDFGSYSYIVTIFTFLFVFSRFGLNDIVISDVSNACSESYKLTYISNSLLVKFSISFLFWLLFAVIGLWTIQGEMYLLYLLVTSSVLLQSSDIIEYYQQAIVDIKKIVLLKKGQTIFSIASKILFIYLELNLDWFVFLLALDVLVLSTGYIYLLYKLIGEDIIRRFDYNIMSEIVAKSWPIALSNLAMICYVKLDHIFIFSFLSSSDLGVYAAAARLSEAWYFIPTIIATTFFPKILSAKKDSSSKYTQSLIKLYRIQIGLSLIVGLFVTLVAKYILLYAYGDEFYDGIGVLVIHIWAGLFISISRVSVKWYISEGYQVLFFVKSIIGLAFSVISLYILVPFYGIIGGAISLLLTLFLVEVLVPLLNEKSRPLFFMILNSVGLKL